MRIISDPTPHKSMRLTDLRKIKAEKPTTKNTMLFHVWHDGKEYMKGEVIEDAEILKVFKKKKFVS